MADTHTSAGAPPPATPAEMSPPRAALALDPAVARDMATAHEYWKEWVVDPEGRCLPFPIRQEFAGTIEMEERIDGNHWPHSEIRPSESDRISYERLKYESPKGGQIVRRDFTLFLRADEIVMDGLDNIDMAALPIEIRNLVRARNAQEVTHSKVYGKIATFTLTPEELDEATQLTSDHPALRDMRAWAMRYMQPGTPVFVQLAVCAIFEVVAFSAPFVIPHTLKRLGGVCPALTNANETISRDETLHMDSGAISLNEAFSGASPHVRGAAWRVIQTVLAEGYATMIPVLEWIFEGDATLLDVSLEPCLQWTRHVCNRFSETLNSHDRFSDVGGRDLPFPADTEADLKWMETMAVDANNQRPLFFETTGMQYDLKFPEGAFDVGGAAEIAAANGTAAEFAGLWRDGCETGA